MDQKFEKWKEWLDEIYDQVVDLVTNRRSFSEVWAIVNLNPKLQKPNSFYKLLDDTYAAYGISAVRRQIKPQKGSISFVGLLKEIMETPDVLSRDRFVNLYVAGMKNIALTYIKNIANDTFDKEFAAKCMDHIDPNIVQSDLDRLKKYADKLEDFADKRVAHYDKRAPKHIPTFAELDACIDFLEKLMRKYWLLFEGSDLGDDLVVEFTEDYWHEIFRQPWISPDEAEQ